MHIPYPPGSYGVCLFVHTVLIEMMSHDIFRFHHVSVRCHTRAYTLVSEIIWSLLVCENSPYREDEPCYDILIYFIMFLLDAILGQTP